MKTHRRWLGILTLMGSLGLLSVEAVWAQVAPERLAAVRATLERVKAFSQRLPEPVRKGQSSGARNLLHLAKQWDQLERRLHQAPLGLAGLHEALRPRILASSQVSDPSTDVVFSSFSGFTQSETSTAWCGNNVVVGFNDTGSFFESLFAGGGVGLSFNGVASSTNKGGSFTDLGFLNPGPTDTDMLAGDPALGCSDPNTFCEVTNDP